MIITCNLPYFMIGKNEKIKKECFLNTLKLKKIIKGVKL